MTCSRDHCRGEPFEGTYSTGVLGLSLTRANAASTGVAQIAAGSSSASPAAARSARPGPLARRNSPTTVGPDPLTNAASAPASSACSSACSISGHSETAAACRSLCNSSRVSGAGAPSSNAISRSCGDLPQRLRRALDAEPVRARVHLGGGQLARDRQHEHAKRMAGRRQLAQALTGAGGKPPSGDDLRGHIRPQSRRELEQQLVRAKTRCVPGQAQRRRRVRRPASQTGGHGNALDDAQPQRPDFPAGLLAEHAQRPRRQVLARRRGTPRAPSVRASHRRAARAAVARSGPPTSVSSSASEIDCITLASSCRPSSRTSPTNSPRLIFAGALARRCSAPHRSVLRSGRERAARKSSGARRSARTSSGWPSSLSARRISSRECPPTTRRHAAAGQPLRRCAEYPRPRARASPPGSCAGARTLRPPAHAARATAPLSAACDSTESTFGSG